MALTDWHIFSAGTAIRAHNAATPILGSTSLVMEATSNSPAAKINIDISDEAGAVAGTTYAFTKGKIRSLFRVEDIGNSTHQGLYCLASVGDLANGSGNCYGVNFKSPENDFHLNKYTGSGLVTYSGTSGGGMTNLQNTSSGTAWADDTLIAVELEWDASSGTQVDLIVRTGSATDYSDLAQILSHTDASSPHVTSLGEGIFAMYHGGPARIHAADSTQIFSIA